MYMCDLNIQSSVNCKKGVTELILCFYFNNNKRKREGKERENNNNKIPGDAGQAYGQRKNISYNLLNLNNQPGQE